MAGNQVNWWRSIATGSITNWTWIGASSTDIDGLANGSWKAAGEISNTTDYHRYITMGILLQSASNMSADSVINLYLCPILRNNDARRDVYDSTFLTETYCVGSFRCKSGDTVTAIVAEGIKINPIDYVVVVENRTGVAMAASTLGHVNRISYVLHNEEIQPSS